MSEAPAPTGTESERPKNAVALMELADEFHRRAQQAQIGVESVQEPVWREAFLATMSAYLRAELAVREFVAGVSLDA